MPHPYRHVFEPIQLRHKTLRNRIVFGAHTANMAEQGLPGDRHLGYYRERALGGAAMLVIEPMPVHAAAVLTRGNFLPSDDAVIPHFRRITQACHEHGAVILQQLYHVGQHGDADNSWHPNWSPSGHPSYHDSDGSHRMSEAEIEITIDGFVQAARRCQAAGFDGVEVWAAYHCIVDQFWTPWSNHRDDRWGGSLENRTRFSREIIQRIRKLCGEDFIIGLSVSDEPDYKVTLQHEAMSEIIEYHDRDALVDYVSCGTGSYFDFYKLMPTFLYPEKLGTNLSEVLKSNVKHALITCESHIRTPENAEAVISANQADLISIVRGQIADPHLANKAWERRGAEIRGCLSCNQMCWGRRSRDYWISCVVNPSVGREFEWGGDRFETTQQVRNVMIVGAGPAGLEAARVAAECGHQVTLYEASGQLGGQFRLAGLQPRRSQILDLIQWYEQQLQRLGVSICFNQFIDVDDVHMASPDCVIVATGSLPADTGFQKFIPEQPGLPGFEAANVCSIEEVMQRSVRMGQRVVVFDEAGNWRGGGTAWKLAEDGHDVTLVTPDPMVGRELQRSATDFPLRQRLAQAGVRFVTESGLLEWTDRGARVVSYLTSEEQWIEADSLVFSATNIAEDTLARALESASFEVINIGDSLAPRQAAIAIHEGRKAAREL